MAEICTAEISIKARNGQDHPIGVLGLVGAVVSYKSMNNLCWNILGSKQVNCLHILGWEGYFILPKCAKLQGIGKDIVKAEHPRAFGGAREDRGVWNCLTLLRHSLSKPFASALELFCAVLLTSVGLSFKVNNSVNVTIEPTTAVLIHKRGKLSAILPKVRSVLPLLFSGGFFAVWNTAPRKERATGDIYPFFWFVFKYIAVLIVEKIPTCKDLLFFNLRF